MAATRDEVYAAIRNADAAGDGDSVLKLGAYLKTLDAPAQSAPSGDQIGAGQAALIGAGRGLTQLGRGVQQAYYGLTGDQQAQDALKSKVDEENRLYAPLQGVHPIATALGEAAPVMAALPAAGGLAGIVGLGALPGLVGYGSAGEKLKEGALGAAGSLVGAGIGKVVAKAAQPMGNALKPGIAALADKFGVPLDVAQSTGARPLRSLLGVLRETPGSAGVMAEADAAQKLAFNKAALGLMGETGDSIGQDGAALAQRAIGGRLDAAAQGVTLDLTHNVVQNELAGVEKTYMRNLTADQKPLVKNVIEDILQAGQIDGATYQAWRSRLGQIAQGTRDSEYKGALKGIQSVLDRAFDRAAPPDQAAAMAAARAQYQNFKTLDPLLNKAEMSTGNISPPNVMNRVVVKGNQQPDMRDLATLGQSMGEYANSGTPARQMWQHPISTALSVIPARIAAQIVNSPLGKKYLTQGLLDMTPELEQRLMQAGAGGGLLGLNALLPNR